MYSQDDHTVLHAFRSCSHRVSYCTPRYVSSYAVILYLLQQPYTVRLIHNTFIGKGLKFALLIDYLIGIGGSRQARNIC